MFVQSSKFVESHQGNRGGVTIYGQESNPTTRKLCLMNLAIRGIEADIGEFHEDSFHNDLHKTLKADYVLANPPFNLSNWGIERLQGDPRWKYGTPPNGNANYAWIQHMIHHLSPNGKLGLVLANGSLSSNTGGEGEIRRKIVEDDLVWGIVALPSQLFYGVQIPATLWFISRNKPQKGKTLFVDARKMGEMKTRRLRELSEADILKIADAFTAFDEGRLDDVKGFCASATLDDIKKQDYILTPGRYVGVEDQEDDGEPFDEKMARLTGEIGELWNQSHELEGEIRRRLGAIGYEIE
jgi:type I restriction enzyme M protein